MLKQLASTMGVEALRRRLSGDSELRPHLVGLFPREAIKAERAINVYGAMGLPELATDLRQWWEEQRQSSKRPRE